MPDDYDVEGSTEEEQRAVARAYADKFCRAGKPSTLNMYAAIRPEELYDQRFPRGTLQTVPISYST